MIAALLLTASFTGCIGFLDDEDPLPDEEDPSARLFVSAVHENETLSTAVLDSASIAFDGDTAPAPFRLTSSDVDLGELSSNGTAILVGSTNATGDVASITVQFDDVTVDGASFTDQRVTVPVAFPLEEEAGIDVTLTLDLETTLEQEEAAFANLVVHDGDERIETVTRADLEPREEPPELPRPTIHAIGPDGNNTGPSFETNDEITFTYQIPEDTDATVENVFWSFGDDNTGQGENATHAYRAPGFYQTTVILEGERGQQAIGTLDIDAYHLVSDNDNIGAGTGGLGGVEDRDVKEHTFDVPLNATNITATLTQHPSGGACAEEEEPEVNECAPSNLHIELYNPDGDKVAQDTSDEENKTASVTGLLGEGEWTLRVLGDQGFAIGYDYTLQASFNGLCEDAGGLPGYECGEPPEPIEEDDDELL